MLQFSDFTCPTERSTSAAGFKNVNGKCYFIAQGGCKANGFGIWCTFQQAQDQCKTAFGAGIFGKVFEPTSIEDNDAVLKAAYDAFSNWAFWIGVSNKPLKYKSNNKPVSISTIPWGSGQPSTTASETKCLIAGSWDLKWYANYPCSHTRGYTICETSFPS